MTNVSIYKSVNHSGDVSGPSVGTFRFRRGGEDGKFFYNAEAVILSGPSLPSNFVLIPISVQFANC